MRSSRAIPAASAMTRLLERIPGVDDLQARWLLLRSCAATRANYLLRILPPHLTADYAAEHDAAVARCLSALLLSGSEGSVSAPPALTATQRTGLPGATLCPSSGPGRLLRPPVSTLPCRATGPCHRPPQESTPRHSCAMLVTRRQNGQRSAPAPSPSPPPLTVLTTPGRSGDGSASLPVRAMSLRMRRILLTSLLRLVRCCSRRQGNSPPAPSTLLPHPR